MKTSLRLPFTLLLLIALFTLLNCRSALHGSTPESEPVSKPIKLLNHTLLSLASVDVTELQLKQHVDDLILQSHLLNPHSKPATRNERILPEFRRALHSWIRNRHFDPLIMSDLARLVKRPLDLYSARPEPETDPPKPYPTCAVVGNSGILLESDNGDRIDGHDAVIRLNNARTQGYNRHVGSKTTLSFVNSNILHLCARRHGCFCHPYGEAVPIIMYICQPLHFLDFAACGASHKSPLLITDPRFDVLCARIVKYYSLKRFVEETGKGIEEWGAAHDEKMFHYSSGMQAVVLAMGICREVSVFGFGKSKEVKHHYHTNQKAELDLHDYVAEYEFYRDLVERPQVIPFLNESGFVVPPVVFYQLTFDSVSF